MNKIYQNLGSVIISLFLVFSMLDLASAAAIFFKSSENLHQGNKLPAEYQGACDVNPNLPGC